MSILCGCPRGAEIGDILIDPCPENFGQIQKIIFQRLLNGTAKNKFAPNAVATPTDPTLLATWTPLLAASDDTKVVQTPYLNAPETEPGAARMYGGGNQTLGGIEIVLGADPTGFKGKFLATSQASIKALKEYGCEKVGVFFVDEFGRIGAVTNGEASDSVDLEIYPIEIRSLFVGDKKFGGFEEPDSNALEFKMLSNWSNNFTIITPSDFDALTELATP